MTPALQFQFPHLITEVADLELLHPDYPAKDYQVGDTRIHEFTYISRYDSADGLGAMVGRLYGPWQKSMSAAVTGQLWPGACRSSMSRSQDSRRDKGDTVKSTVCQNSSGRGTCRFQFGQGLSFPANVRGKEADLCGKIRRTFL